MESQFKYKWFALIGLCLLAFTAFLDNTIVNTALPFIQVDLKATIIQLQWVVNIFAMLLSMTMIAVGKFADLFGRRKVFYIGVVIFGIAAIGAGLSSTIQILVFFRALQALGASIIFIASSALLADVFPENERVRAVSIYGGVTGLGLMIGPFLGGILVAMGDWRWVFWINIPLIILGLGFCSFSLKGQLEEHRAVKIDWLGLFLLIFGLGTLMFGIIMGAEEEWTSTIGWISLAIGVISLVSLIILDNYRENPLLDLHIFNEKVIVLAALSCALAGVASTVFMFFDPLYLKNVRDLPPFNIGLLIATIPVAQVLISLLFEKAVNLFGVVKLLFISILASFLAVTLHRFIGMDTPLLYLLLPFFLLGVNWGLSNAGSITAINQVIAKHEIAAAMGTIGTIWNVAGSIILAISTAVFDSVEKKSSFLPAYLSAIDFNFIFALGIVLWALGIGWSLFYNKSFRS